jgi:PPOX class probable F420-dependent enzyme
VFELQLNFDPIFGSNHYKLLYVNRNVAKGTNNQITEPVAKLLQDKNFASLSTLMSDGSPQVTPTWVDVDIEDNVILINTTEGRLKSKNISRDPRVALSITDRFNPYNMVTIKGKVISQTNQGADEHIDKLAKKYLDVDRYPRVLESLRPPDEKRIILKIKPEKIFHFPFSFDKILGR